MEPLLDSDVADIGRSCDEKESKQIETTTACLTLKTLLQNDAKYLVLNQMAEVVTWGYAPEGGDSYHVQHQLRSCLFLFFLEACIKGDVLIMNSFCWTWGRTSFPLQSFYYIYFEDKTHGG